MRGESDFKFACILCAYTYEREKEKSFSKEIKETKENKRDLENRLGLKYSVLKKS